MKDKINTTIGKIHASLCENFVPDKISVEEYNEKIAPHLSELGMIADGVKVTARTFRIHKSLFEEK